MIKDGMVLRVCQGLSCNKGAQQLEEAAARYIENKGLEQIVGLEHEFCFGRCMAGPNVLVERWRDGKRNEAAMISLMMNVKHPDLHMESGARPEDIPGLIEHHRRAWDLGGSAK